MLNVASKIQQDGFDSMKGGIIGKKSGNKNDSTRKSQGEERQITV